MAPKSESRVASPSDARSRIAAAAREIAERDGGPVRTAPRPARAPVARTRAPVARTVTPTPQPQPQPDVVASRPPTASGWSAPHTAPTYEPPPRYQAAATYEPAPTYQTPPPAPTGGAQVYRPASGSSKADTAFVLGIVSIFANFFYIPGILAIVWGGRERHDNPKARTGWVLGIIGTVLSGLITIMIFAIMASVSSAVDKIPAPAPDVPSVTVPSGVAPSGSPPATAAKPAGGNGFGSAACTQAMAESARAAGNAATHQSDPAAIQRSLNASAAQLEAC